MGIKAWLDVRFVIIFFIRTNDRHGYIIALWLDHRRGFRTIRDENLFHRQ